MTKCGGMGVKEPSSTKWRLLLLLKSCLQKYTNIPFHCAYASRVFHGIGRMFVRGVIFFIVMPLSCN